LITYLLAKQVWPVNFVIKPSLLLSVIQTENKFSWFDWLVKSSLFKISTGWRAALFGILAENLCNRCRLYQPNGKLSPL